MAITKTDVQLEQIGFSFDDEDNVIDMVVQMNFALNEDDEQITRVRKTKSIWDKLTPTERTKANQIAQRVKTLIVQMT